MEAPSNLSDAVTPDQSCTGKAIVQGRSLSSSKPCTIAPLEPSPSAKRRKHRAADAALAAPVGAGAPPILTGGVNCQNKGKFDLEGHENALGIDWLQGTVAQEHLKALCDYLSERFGPDSEKLKYGHYRYDRQRVWHPYDVYVFYDSDAGKCQAIHDGRVTIQIKASALNVLDAKALFCMCHDLHEQFHFRATRIDLCFDDYQRIISPHEVAEVAAEGNFTGFRKYDPRAPRRISGELIGDSVYFGTRGKNGAGRYLRNYDKKLESKGEIDSVRWEVEFSKDMADAVMSMLAMVEGLEEFAGVIGKLIGGSIDFIDRDGTHIDRMERLEFWQRIIDLLGCVKLRKPKPIKTLDKVKTWVKNSVMPSLKTIKNAMGEAEYNRWMDESAKNVAITQRQMSIIKLYQAANNSQIRL